VHSAFRPTNQTSRDTPDMNTGSMPVIVGAPRSGTTLLRFMLDAHPDVAIPPETGFLMLGGSFRSVEDALREEFFEAVTTFPPDAPAWTDFGISRERFWSLLQEVTPFTVAEGYRVFYRAYAERFGKRRLGDKTPMYCLHLRAIEEILPEAHFIHVIRDGRDVALSLRHTWFSPGHDIETLAEHWTRCVTAARQQGAHCRHYLEIRFEDLIHESRAVLTRVCAFLDLPYSPEMLAYHRRTRERLTEHGDRRRPDGTLVVSHAGRLRQQALTMQPPQRSRVQSWRKQMSRGEQSRFEAVAGRLLGELGYGDLIGGRSSVPHRAPDSQSESV
jgi:Sulfotransferase family